MVCCFLLVLLSYTIYTEFTGQVFFWLLNFYFWHLSSPKDGLLDFRAGFICQVHQSTLIDGLPLLVSTLNDRWVSPITSRSSHQRSFDCHHASTTCALACFVRSSHFFVAPPPLSLRAILPKLQVPTIASACKPPALLPPLPPIDALIDPGSS